MTDEPTVVTDATIEAVTLHADGTFGVMFRRHAHALPECSCGWSATVYPMESRRAVAKRRLENIRRLAWEDRVATWLASTVRWASWGFDNVRPMAPEGTPREWRWSNWSAFDDETALNIATARAYGCTCSSPLVDWRIRHGVPQEPRCRECGAEAPHE